jgi:hypothetical protein
MPTWRSRLGLAPRTAHGFAPAMVCLSAPPAGWSAWAAVASEDMPVPLSRAGDRGTETSPEVPPAYFAATTSIGNSAVTSGCSRAEAV